MKLSAIQSFLPANSKEWSLVICLIFALVMLILFYKALMKTKDLLSTYAAEQRNFKLYYNLANDFITYCSENQLPAVESYLDYKNMSDIEFISLLKACGDDYAGLL